MYFLIFFSPLYKDGTIKLLEAMNAVSASEKRRREDNIIKDIKNLFRLRK